MCCQTRYAAALSSLCVLIRRTRPDDPETYNGVLAAARDYTKLPSERFAIAEQVMNRLPADEPIRQHFQVLKNRFITTTGRGRR